MAEYRTTDNGERVYVEKRGGAGRVIGIILVLALLLAAIGFYTGFFSANVKSGSLPQVDVSAKGGSMPKVDLDSKKIVVGTKETQVDVPKVKTEKETISVPAVGVTEGKTDKK